MDIGIDCYTDVAHYANKYGGVFFIVIRRTGRVILQQEVLKQNGKEG